MINFFQIGAEPSKVGLPQLPAKEDNPLFNFDSKFISGLQSISPTELGMSVPFISLKAVDDQGNMVHDFSLDFFDGPLKIEKFKEGRRHPERPTISLKEVRIKTDFASGYLYYTEVTIELKVHKPNNVVDGTLLALLFPGAPLELEFGWNSPNTILNKKSVLKFALKSYNINIGIDGQTDLTIEGTAFNERFNNTYIGDYGDRISEIASGELKSLDAEKDILKDNLSSNYEIIQSWIEYLKNLETKKDKSGVRNYDLIKSTLSSYDNLIQRVRGTIRANFKKRYDLLTQSKQKSSEKLKVYINRKNTLRYPGGFIRLHDIIETLCFETFNAMQTGLFNDSTAKYRFVYGQFHEEVGLGVAYSNKPIADFPIDWQMFQRWYQDEVESKGEVVLTVEALFEILSRNFLENAEYWKKLEDTKDGVRTPDIAITVNNFKLGQQRFIDISLIDTSSNIPITSSEIKSIKKNASQTDFEKLLLRKGPMAIIEIGHANSFLKELSLTNIMDEQIKSALIARMAEHSNVIDTKSFIPPAFQVNDTSNVKTPLQLPLQGKMTVLGHVEWKPFRSFVLNSGIYVIDGIYKILSVEHVLNPEGFQSQIEFMYH